MHDEGDVQRNFAGKFRMLYLLLLPCFVYSTGAFKNGDKVDVYVNKVGPYANIHETYHFYQLPLCRPEKIVHKSLSLGQVLEGDRMAESAFKLQFGNDQKETSLCGEQHLTKEDVDQLITAVEEEYYFEIIIDDIRVRDFVGFVEEGSVFPHQHKVFMYTSYQFNILANSENVLKVNLTMGNPIELAHEQSISLDLKYKAAWNITSLPISSRVQEGPPIVVGSLRIQWISIASSAILASLLVMIVAIIIMSSVRRDLSNYNKENDEDLLLDNGWKTIGMDVFRKPLYPMLLSAVLGVGSQFLVLCAVILVIGSLNLVNVHRHSHLNTLCVVLYALTSGISGFISASKYRQLDGKHWIANINLTSILFVGPLFLTWAVSNSVFWWYNNTSALPWTTVLVVCSIWLVFGYPLTVIGGVVGRTASGKYSAPCRTRNIPRQLPPLSCLYSSPVFAFIGGFLPFSAISVELYYIFSTIYGREVYTLFYIMLLVFAISIAVVGSLSIALTYFQLNSEDYRWWWRSVFLGGSLGVFVFFYGIYFLFHHSEMSGTIELVEFFTDLALICYATFLTMGTVSHFAVHQFVQYLYSSVKTD